MSTAFVPAEPEIPGAESPGAPSLTPLGKRIEMLRIERGISKQLLARNVGTSRQQLWRVLTGKSELTGALCQRLAEVFQVDARLLRGPETKTGNALVVAAAAETASATRSPKLYAGPVAGPATLAEYVADPAHVTRTLDTLPPDTAGLELKRELLNAVEDMARRAGVRLPEQFFVTRGRVVNGDL